MTEAQIFELDLPQPSEQLIEAIQKFAATVKPDPDDKPWLDASQGNTVNSVESIFARAEPLDYLLQQEYGQYFTDTNIFAVVGVMQNLDLTLACLPPHIDQKRALAINYYVELGGANVVTSFYDVKEPTLSDAARNYRYNEVSKTGHYKFKSNQWYAFDAAQCHSIENIETKRLIIMIFRTDNIENYTITDFIKQNMHIKSRQVYIEKQ
jgi:hypothetical protein